MRGSNFEVRGQIDVHHRHGCNGINQRSIGSVLVGLISWWFLDGNSTWKNFEVVQLFSFMTINDDNRAQNEKKVEQKKTLSTGIKRPLAGIRARVVLMAISRGRPHRCPVKSCKVVRRVVTAQREGFSFLVGGF